MNSNEIKILFKSEIFMELVHFPIELMFFCNSANIWVESFDEKIIYTLMMSSFSQMIMNIVLLVLLPLRTE